LKIALAHFRLGETDGVSLEMEKWKYVLEKMGHTVIFISGTRGYGDYYLQEMDYHSEAFKSWEYNSFVELKDYRNEDEFKTSMLECAEEIEAKISKIISDEEIETIVPNNIFSLGMGLPVAVGFYNAIKYSGISSINHNHDFYWEREHMSSPTCPFVSNCLNRYFPPSGPEFTQLVINHIAQAELKRRKGVESIVVPNVFDFLAPLWEIDQFNSDLRSRLGIGENDIVFLQATRIEKRKAIEISIETVGEIGKRKDELTGKLYDNRTFSANDRLVLLMPGLVETGKDYVHFLKQKANREGVELIWADSLFGARRKEQEGKQYSLWDAYAISDMITYPSILEGWGNQYLEGLFARKPMIIFEYPVFQSDILQFGFKNISLGSDFVEKEENGLAYVSVNREMIEDAAKEAIELLKNKKKYETFVNKNFEIASQELSYKALEKMLDDIF